MKLNRIISVLVAALAGAVLVTVPSTADAWRQCGAVGRPDVGGQEVDWVVQNCSIKNVNANARTIMYTLPIESSVLEHHAWLRGQGSNGFMGRFVAMDQNGVFKVANALQTSTSSTPTMLDLGTITPTASQGWVMYVQALAEYQSVLHQVLWDY